MSKCDAQRGALSAHLGIKNGAAPIALACRCALALCVPQASLSFKRRRFLPNMDGPVGPSPPLVPTHPLWRFQSTTFLVNAGLEADPSAYLRSIQTCIEQLSKRCNVVRFKPGCSLKMSVTPRAGGEFLVKVKLYAMDCARGTWAVELHKRRGCSVAFYHLFNAFLRRSLKSRC